MVRVNRKTVGRNMEIPRALTLMYGKKLPKDLIP